MFLLIALESAPTDPANHKWPQHSIVISRQLSDAGFSHCFLPQSLGSLASWVCKNKEKAEVGFPQGSMQTAERPCALRSTWHGCPVPPSQPKAEGYTHPTLMAQSSPGEGHKDK